MMKGLRFSKQIRLLAAFLAVMLVGTFWLSGMISVKGYTGYTVITDGIDLQYVTDMGTNLLEGKTPRIFSILNGNKVEISEVPGGTGANNASTNYTKSPGSAAWGSSAQLTDGKLFSSLTADNFHISGPGKDSFPDYFVELSYDLGGSYDINKLLFVSGWRSASNLCIREYELYVSKTYDTLFEAQNKVLYYDNTGKWANDANHSGAAQAFLFRESADLYGKYFGVRILKEHPSAGTYTYVLDELGVYGAAASDIRVATDGVDEQYVAALGQNLLAGKAPRIFSVLGGNKVEIAEVPGGTGPNNASTNYTKSPGSAVWGSSAQLTDGKLFSTNNADNFHIVGPSKASYPDYYVQLTYDLGGTYDVEQMLFVSGWRSANNLCIREYELYVSETYDALFAIQSKVLYYDNTDKWANDANHSGAAQVFLCKPSADITGRYFGVKIIKEHPTATGYTYVLDELGVYGKQAGPPPPTLDVVTEGIDAQFVTDMGQNLLESKAPRIFAVLNNSAVEIVETPDGTGPNNAATNYTKSPGSNAWGSSAQLTDGELYSADNAKNFHVQGPGKASFPNYYVQLTFDLGDYYGIDKLLLVNAWRAARDIGLQEYEFYVSDDFGRLFDTENLAVYYDNKDRWGNDPATHPGAAQAFIFGGSGKPEGRYVGLKMIAGHPTADNYLYILDELAVIGTKMDACETTKTGVDEDYAAGLGENLLAAFTPTFISTVNGSPVALTEGDDTPSAGNNHTANTGEYAALADGALFGNTGAERVRVTGPSGGTYHLDIVYDLEKTFQAHDILMAGAWLNTADTCLKEYEVYVSKRRDTLFGNDNLAVAYDNAGTWSSAPYDGGAQAFHFPRKNKPSGRYLGIRILSGNADSVRTASISEIGLYGNPDFSDSVNLLAGKPVDAYLTNAAGKIEHVSDTNLTAEEKVRLANGKTSGLAADGDEAAIETNGKILDLVYDLGKVSDVEEFSVYSAAGTEITECKVFAAKTESGVWEDKAEIYHGVDQGYVSMYEVFPALSCRYVRFRIIRHGGAAVQIGELAAMGGKNQAMPLINLLSARGEYEITGWYEDRQSFERTELYPFPQNADENSNLLTDGKTADSVNISVPGGEKTADLLVRFNAVCVFSKAEISIAEPFSGQIRVFIGDSADEVFGEAAVPASEQAYPAGSAAVLEFPPREGRYLRISVQGAESPDGLSVDVGEIAAYGYMKQGITNEYNPDVASTLLDLATGIRLDILKQGNLDIYSKVAKIEVGLSDLNDTQKALLDAYSFVISGKVITVSLYDRVGDPVAQIGGRELRLYFPIPVSLLGGISYLGVVSDDSVDFVNAAYEGGRLVAKAENPVGLSYLIATDEEFNPGGGDESGGTNSGAENGSDSDETGGPSTGSNPISHVLALSPVFAAGVIFAASRRRTRARKNRAI